MFYHVVVKWFTITAVALCALLLVLLFLGYLLKENEAVTTKLKAQLDHDAYLKQEKENAQSLPFANIPKLLTSLEKSQQNIVAEHRSCQTDNQCFVVHTHNQTIGCIVVVNKLGAVILLKTVSQNKGTEPSANLCGSEYSKKTELLAQCRNNLCMF